MHEKENEIKFYYVQNSRCLATIIYDDRSMYIKTVWQYDTSISCYRTAGKHLQNDLAKKSGKAYVVPVVPVATPLENHMHITM